MCRFLIIAINDGRGYENYDEFSNTSLLTDILTSLKEYYMESHAVA